MRRILLAVLILILPTATAIVVYLVVTKTTPTNRAAIGRVTTIAGSGSPGVEDGPAMSASFSDPFGIAVDKRGNVIVADGGQSNRIRRITVDGKVHTIAGANEGFADGDAQQARFNTPSGIAIDNGGNIIIADTSNNRIRKLSSDGTKVSTIAGSGVAGFKDGSAGEAQFDGPIGIAVDKHGNVFVADAYNDSIRKITEDGAVTTFAGTGLPGFNDGQAPGSAFDTPCGVAVDEDGNVFVADTGNHAVRKITAQGEVTTIAGGTGAGSQGGEVRLNRPVGIGVTHDGFLFISDEGSGKIVRIAPDGEGRTYAGSVAGFVDSVGGYARLNGPSSIAIDQQGVLYVADSQNYLIRQIAPSLIEPVPEDPGPFVQPSEEAVATNEDAVIPKLNLSVLGVGKTFPWPVSPQESWHEIAGVVGEARGAAGGVALDHIHSGLDIHGNSGEPTISVFDEKVSSPIPNWDFDGSGEGIHVGLFSYIHIRVGRNATGDIQAPERFKSRIDNAGKLFGVRVRRGTRFRVGDYIGAVNRLNHVHLNLGPGNAQANPLVLPFFALKDTVVPTVESIEVVPRSALATSATAKDAPEPFKDKHAGHLIVSGDVAILVTAYDRVDGNGPSRKLGLFRIGYQLLYEDGTAVKRFEQPLINIEFNRLPAEDSSVFKVYAPGSGVSAYGTPTKFRYIVTNRVRDGEAREGFLRTSNLKPGNYTIKIIAEDYAGNRGSGPSTQLAITVKN
ncbi:MAG TPA: NHL repeat-containing protein [Blastocatellia bacterium]|nr:NHL repeat-containing protein [Blastocatellia bacterium]